MSEGCIQGHCGVSEGCVQGDCGESEGDYQGHCILETRHLKYYADFLT